MLWSDTYNTGNDGNAYEAFLKFFKALQERQWAIDGDWFPRHSIPFDQGTIGSIDQNEDGIYEMQDLSKHWMITDDHHTDAPRWTDWSTTGVPAFVNPAHYDVVLNCEDPDPTKQIRRQINLNDENKLYIEHVDNWVTGGWIPSISFLIGKPYVIIRRAGVWFGERWPDAPNDEELWVGSGDSRTVISVSGAGWSSQAFSGKKYKRGTDDPITIEDNGPDFLVIPRQSVLPAGTFKILDTDGVTELYSGTIGTVYDGISNINLKAVPFSFPSGELANLDLVIYAGQVLLRIVITNNDANTVWFPRQVSETHGDFSILPTGKKAWPGQLPWPTAQWYGGVSEDYYTHKADDIIYQPSLQTTPMAAQSLKYSSGSDENACEDVTLSFDQLLDQDIWSDNGDRCREADFCYSPNLYKTYRGLQARVLEICHFFVPVDDYDGAAAIPFFTPATLFEKCGINFVGRYTAVPDVDGNYTFTFAALDQDPYWAILDPDGNPISDGVGGKEGTLTFAGGTEGKTYTLVVSKGWTRYKPRWFQYAYPRSGFIPDYKTDEFGNKTIIIPGDAKTKDSIDYPGTWISRDKSSEYLMFEPIGYASDAGGEFVVGDRARYIGNGWGAPGIDPATAENEDGPLDTLYYRNLWEGRFRKDVRGDYQTRKQGVVDYAGGKWIKAKQKDWFGVPMGTGTMRTESGTANGGNTSTLTLAAKYFTYPVTMEDPDPDTIPDPYWAGDRFKDMVLEVDKTVSGQTVTYHTPILSIATTPSGDSPTTSTITFTPVAAYTIPAVYDSDGTTVLTPAISVPALTVASGDAYRIKEPAYRLNWWKGRKVTITSTTTGTKFTSVVTYNDADYLWFTDSPSFSISEMDTFEIVELNPGYVYEWSGTEWVEPADNVNDLDLSDLLEKNDKLYGPVVVGDYFGEHVPQELCAAINALVWTFESVKWPNFPSPDSDLIGVQAFERVAGWDRTEYIWSAARTMANGYPFDETNWPNWVDWFDAHPEIIVDSETKSPYDDDYASPRRGTQYGINLSYDSSNPDSPSGNFGGFQDSLGAYPSAINIPAVLSSEVDFYARAETYNAFMDAADYRDLGVTSNVVPDPATSGTSNMYDETQVIFNSYGTGLSRGVFTLTSTATTDTNGVATGSRLGSADVDDLLSKTVEPTHPTSAIPHSYREAIEGYIVSQSKAVIRWNVAGGMTYLT